MDKQKTWCEACGYRREAHQHGACPRAGGIRITVDEALSWVRDLGAEVEALRQTLSDAEVDTEATDLHDILVALIAERDDASAEVGKWLNMPAGLVEQENEALHLAAFAAHRGEPYDCTTWRVTEVYELVEGLRQKMADAETCAPGVREHWDDLHNAAEEIRAAREASATHSATVHEDEERPPGSAGDHGPVDGVDDPRSVDGG